jgi:hypothetical protein
MERILRLDEELNPEYYGLFREYNSLFDRWNQINNDIHTFKVAKLSLLRTKTRLFLIGKKLAELQKDYLIWQGKARSFCLKPNYAFEPGTGSDLAYSHFTNALRDQANHLESYMQLIVYNYNRKYDLIDSKRNFLIAIGSFAIGTISFWLAFLSLILGLLALGYTLLNL